MQVKDQAAPGAYTAALQGTSEPGHALIEGVAGVIHLALDASNSFSAAPNVDLAVKASVDMTIGILKSANLQMRYLR